jgi:hypothetical protein
MERAMGIEPIVRLRQRIEILQDISRLASKTVQNESSNFLALRK